MSWRTPQPRAKWSGWSLYSSQAQWCLGRYCGRTKLWRMDWFSKVRAGAQKKDIKLCINLYDMISDQRIISSAFLWFSIIILDPIVVRQLRALTFISSAVTRSKISSMNIYFGAMSMIIMRMAGVKKTSDEADLKWWGWGDKDKGDLGKPSRNWMALGWGVRKRGRNCRPSKALVLKLGCMWESPGRVF